MTDPSQMSFLPGAPALHVVSDPALADSGSHWGGTPSVPADWAWPVREDGTALHFIAQLDVAQVQAAGRVSHLPDAGTLLFFYDVEDQPWGFDPKDHDGWKVEYFAPGTALAKLPEEDMQQDAYPRVGMTFKPIETYEEGYPSIEGNDNPDDDTLEQVFDFVNKRNFGEAPHHQIGGYPHAIQNPDMGPECELASNKVWVGNATGYASEEGQALLNKGGAKAWKLVLQVDTDEEPYGLEWMWGDCGMLYFWVKEDAGRAGDFSRAWLVLQCC